MLPIRFLVVAQPDAACHVAVLPMPRELVALGVCFAGGIAGIEGGMCGVVVGLGEAVQVRGVPVFAAGESAQAVIG